MTTKVLKLEPWMANLDPEFDKPLIDQLIEIEPVHYRNGYYLRGDDCWFERNGKAFTMKRLAGSFKFNLELLEVERFNHRQIEALRVIIEARLATKKQKQIYWACLALGELKQTRRSINRAFLRCERN